MSKGGSKSKYLSSSSGESISSSESSEDSSSSEEENKEQQLSSKKAKKGQKAPVALSEVSGGNSKKIKGAPKGVKTIEQLEQFNSVFEEY